MRLFRRPGTGPPMSTRSPQSSSAWRPLAEIVARYRGTALAPVLPPPDDSHEGGVPAVEDGFHNGLQQVQQETLHLLQPSADELA